MRPAYPALLAGTLLAAAATGVSTAEIPEALRRCAAIDDDAQRLACYDRWVAERAADDAAAHSGSPGHEQAPDPVAGFGLPERDDEDELEEISAKVVRIDERANRERIFTLDNGQVWVEDSPTRSVRVKEGDTVRIRAGMFGSYRLSVASSNRATGVDRVR